MQDTPVERRIVQKVLDECGVNDLAVASIRELVRVVDLIERESGVRFVRMEMGVPGLPSPGIGVKAEIDALHKGVSAIYPNIEGIPSLKDEASRFAHLFLNITIDPRGCVPTVGSMQGSMAAFMVTSKLFPQRGTTLFIDPGFPVQKQQHRVLGIPFESFDVYDFRGPKLGDKLKSYLDTGKISSIIYSNPNNPSWICFSEKELEIIGKLASEYDVIVIEDLAYFGMDFRNDISVPGSPPYQVTVAKYTNQYVLLVSSSKVFSYAGQRIGILMISDALYERSYPALKQYFGTEFFGKALVYGALYALSAGAGHSAQFALAALLKSASDGKYNIVEGVREYERKAKRMKQIFLSNGFHLVYERDEDKPLADGFYFTLAYNGLNGSQLLKELLFYGVSAISLQITGSTRQEGLRACVSQVGMDQLDELEQRIRLFHRHHRNGNRKENAN
jgi:aspartate/methionine/tyrosine aminotransferase